MVAYTKVTPQSTSVNDKYMGILDQQVSRTSSIYITNLLKYLIASNEKHPITQMHSEETSNHISS